MAGSGPAEFPAKGARTKKGGRDLFLLLREVGQSVLIGEGVRVEVLAISRKKVKLGVEARGKEAIRYEVWIKRKGENDGSAKK